MNTKYLSSFLTVVEEGSINLAAARLFVSPSALMKQMNSVEEEVGATLLIRGKKGVELTEAGEVFYRGLKELVPAYDDLLKKAQIAGKRGKKGVVIGSWSVACYSIMPQILNYYRIRHPEDKLIFRNIASIGEMQKVLREKEIDVTFSFGGGSRATDGLRHVVLARENPILLIPPTCDIPIKSKMTLDDLRGRLLVTTDGELSEWFRKFNQYVEERYPDIRLSKALENESGLMDMQALAAPCIASGSIVPRDSSYIAVPLSLPEDFREPMISIDLVCRKENDAQVREFIQSAEEAAKVIWFNR